MMALPTVHYHAAAAATNSSLVSVWMPKLQELLFAAGWTIEYADADAIGTGSSSVPAWDKTPEANVDAGIAVYRMPLNGHTTQWFVRVRPGWASNTARLGIHGLQVGTDHNDGVVSNGGPEMAPTPSTSTATGVEWQLAVSEDGFVLVIGTLGSHPMFGFERARSADGTVLDDAWGFNKWTNMADGYESRHVTAAAGSVNVNPPFALLPHEIGHVGSNLTSAESQDATRVIVLGPYMPGGSSLFAPPRLYVIASPADVDGSAERSINVDGGNKAYKAMSSAALPSSGIILVAIE